MKSTKYVETLRERRKKAGLLRRDYYATKKEHETLRATLKKLRGEK